MRYLLILESVAHVDVRRLVGYAEDMCSLISHINELSKYNILCQENTFETLITWDDIRIYVVSKPNYEKIVELCKKYEDIIEENSEKWRDSWQYEGCMEGYVWLTYVNSEEDTDFNEEDCAEILKILDSSQELR